MDVSRAEPAGPGVPALDASAPPTDVGATPPLSSAARRTSPLALWAARTTVGVLMVLSLLPRLKDLHEPLLDRHGFRQTQVAITVWSLLEEGPSVLHYRTPVFGPPWEIPFEFPLFQLTAFVLVKLGINHIDVACRLANLGYFYISAAILYRLCRVFLGGTFTPLCIALFYLACPFNVFWSRTAMIDFASVAFTLGYLLAAAEWLRRDGARVTPRFFVALGTGILAFLAKVTTVPTVLFPLVGTVGAYLLKRLKRPNAAARDWPPRVGWDVAKHMSTIACLLVVPVLVAVLWVRHTDAIKSASEFTDWLTSGALTHWNYGSWDAKTTLAQWSPILERVPYEFFLRWHIAVGCLAICALLYESAGGIAFAAAMLASAFLTVFTFFNLYHVHDYYMMGVSPALSILGGLALSSAARAIGVLACSPILAARAYRGVAVPACVIRRQERFGYVGLIALALIVVWERPEGQMFILFRTHTSPAVEVGRAVGQRVGTDEYVIVADNDWDPAFLYYARRKGFMLRHMEGERSNQFFKKYNFTTLVWRNGPHPVLLSNWKYHRVVASVASWDVIKVSDAPLDDEGK